jgi:hypothetical protein
MGIKQYDPKKVTVILGAHIVTGFADGTFISMVRTGDQWVHKSGSDGEEMRAKTNDFRGELTLTLMQTSSSNTFVQGLLTADELTGEGGVPLLIKDASSDAALAASEYVWVKKDPDFVRAREDTAITWVLSCKRPTMAQSGSQEVG